MSTTKTYTVWCDEPECHVWSVASGMAATAAMVRSEARREGWVRRTGRDLCPFHARVATGRDRAPRGVPVAGRPRRSPTDQPEEGDR